MKIGIYGAGDFCDKVDRTIPYIGVDGGVQSLKQLGIQPQYIVGDFDSLKDKTLLENIETEVLPHIKDDTDTEVAIKHAIAWGYHKIDLYGVTGGRLDHFFTVCRLLIKYKEYQLTIYDRQNKIYLLKPGVHQIEKDGYEFLSFFAIEPCQLTLDGVMYPLENYCLEYQDGLCVSNEILNNVARVNCNQYLFCIQSDNKEKALYENHCASTK